MELIARQAHPAGTDTPYEERVALYQAGIRLYLRLVALHLARQAGRIPCQAVSPSGPSGGNAAYVISASDLELIEGLLPGEHTDLPGSPQMFAQISPLGRRGGGAWGGGTPLSIVAISALDAAQADHPPGTTLSRVYETFLSYAPSQGPGFSLQRSSIQAKRQGSFYTRPALARAVVEGALLPLLDRVSTHAAPPRLLDPAMGSGVFLLEAVHTLVRAGIGTPAEVAEACVFGFDVDPLAVEVAVLSLWIETGARRQILAQNLRRCDAVLEGLPEPAANFDAVVGNPPWGAAFSPADRKAIRKRKELSSTDSFDSFKLFLELAAECSRGTIGMIVPRSILNGSTHSATRDLLLRRFAPYQVRTLHAAEFPRAVAPACSIIFGPMPGPGLILHHVGYADSRVPQAEHRIPARFWTRDRFPLGDGALLDLLDGLGQRHPTLGQVKHLYRVRDVGINYNRASIARRIFYDGEVAEHPDDLPRYRGRNFTRYGSVHRGGWVRHDAYLRLQPDDRLYMSRDTYELPEKVVFRQTADRITATLDRSRMAMGRSVIAIVACATASLLPLLACLNSTLFTGLYRALAGEEGRVLPQVKVATISLLPLPDACLEAGNPAWVQLGEMARLRLEQPGECTPLDHEIDRAVNELFGLTVPEIAALGAPKRPKMQEY